MGFLRSSLRHHHHRLEHDKLQFLPLSNFSTKSLPSFPRAASWILLSLFASVNLFWYLSTDPHSIYLESRAAIVNAELARTASIFCSDLKYRNQSCDLSRGQWIYDPDRQPLYTNETCKHIFPNQNCMKNGRPDRGYMHWRWKPQGCDLPPFNSTIFLQLMRGKKLLFVGDSLARNHMESLLCALSQVEAPKNLRDSYGMEAYWRFPSFDFTLSMIWSPFLVNHKEEKEGWKIYLDEPEPTWTRWLQDYDVAVFSTTYWFFRRSRYYAEGKEMARFDPANAKSKEFLEGMRGVWRSVLKEVVKSKSKKFQGVAVVRTVSASHFEGDAWDKGGTCNRKEPYNSMDMAMEVDWTRAQIRKVQVEEFRNAMNSKEQQLIHVHGSSSPDSEDLDLEPPLPLHLLQQQQQRPPFLKLMDVTYSSFMRPDAHPGEYRIQSSNEPKHDCVHWCMPGAVDSWNQLLLADPDIVCSSSTGDFLSSNRDILS